MRVIFRQFYKGASMPETQPSTKPLWLDTASIHRFGELTGELTVDVCIVGGGITGLTAADILKKAGKTVAVIEMNRVGQAESGHTSAHLTEILDIDFEDLISSFGLENAKLVIGSVRRAIDKIEDNVIAKKIACEFRRVSGWQYTEKRSEIAQIEREADAAGKLGLSYELTDEIPLNRKVARALRLDRQAQFQPVAYMAALAEQISGGGSHIFELTRMLKVDEGKPCRVTTDRGTIFASDVVIATNVPTTNRLLLQTKIANYRTYCIAIRETNPTDLKNLFWDIDDPYHYVRSATYNGIPHIVIGGEDHKTGQDEHTSIHFQKLEDWAHERFKVEAVTHRWSGQVVEPVDGLPYIGRNSLNDHVYVATGYSGTGLTFGTVAAMLISDLILGIENPWAEVYQATRVKPFAGIKDYLSENIDYPSHLIGDRVGGAQQTDTRGLRENQGAIVRIGGKKVAAYRDPEGELTVLSPVCPHMGCYVHWNEAEISWDCPCHGARFGPKGHLLNGPTVHDLAREDYDENAPMIPEKYDHPIRADDPFSPPLATFLTCPLKAQPT
jgi:glycine/D-amino acid oxidase-like deaminating enzyme/nitrite reductase/ring-hydroxylating ferredoxin subunit